MNYAFISRFYETYQEEKGEENALVCSVPEQLFPF